MASDVNNPSHRQVDWGLLLLRSAGLLVFASAGWEKLHGLLVGIQAGKPLASVGLAPLIAKMGFPLPVLCALYVVANESLGAILISVGLFTRVAAFFAAMSMSAAFYTSLRMGWEPLRAFIYLFIFAALAVSGAGRFSLDFRYLKWKPVSSSDDAGLLILRAGLLAFFVLMFTLKSASATKSFAGGPAVILLSIAAILAVFVSCVCDLGLFRPGSVDGFMFVVGMGRCERADGRPEMGPSSLQRRCVSAAVHGFGGSGARPV
jgi:putative oxidoreductase